MERKKATGIIIGAALIICFLSVYFLESMTDNDIYDEPNFAGTVIEVTDKSIMVSVDEGEEELKSSDKISVALDDKLKDSIIQFNVGDKVRIFYDGTIAESYPAQINKVYEILLIEE